jgi:hypothetical protein
MSSGTFSIMPGPPNPSIDAATFAGTQVPGLIAPGTQPVATLCLDVAARIATAPLSIIQLAYTRAARELCRRSMYLKRNITNAALTVGAPTYNFGTDPNLEVIGIAAASLQQQNTTWIDLREMDQSMVDPNMKNDLPTWYSYLPENMVLFYPTPNYAYLTNVEVVVQTAIGATTIPNDLVSKFNTYIEEGALWHLYLMKDQPWSDLQLAQEAKDSFFEGVGMARAWKDRGYQAGSRRATPRPFISR